MIELRLAFLLFISFVGVYINIWFLLLYFENRNKLMSRVKPTKIPRISVIIPAHNEEKTISKTLKSILSVDYPKNMLDITVVANGCIDKTVEIARKFPVKVIDILKPGKSNAINVGISTAKGSIIGILDADTTVEKSALKKMIGHFDNPNIGAVTTHIKTFEPKGFLQKLQKLEYILSALSKKIISIRNSLYVIPGTLSLIRKDVLSEIGGFSDDTLTEDMDMTFYIHKKGYKIINCLDAVTRTSTPASIKGFFKQRLRWYRGFLETTMKHRDVMFNRKYPDLGIFVIPVSSYLAILVGAFLITLMVLNLASMAFLNIKSLFYISFADQVGVVLQSAVSPLDFFVAPYSVIAYGLIFIGTGITLLISFRFFNFKIKSKGNLVLIPVYVLVYYSLIMICWLSAIILELLRWKKRW